MPPAQHPFFANEVQVVLRAGVSPEALVEPARRTVQRHDANIATKFTTLAQVLGRPSARPSSGCASPSARSRATSCA